MTSGTAFAIGAVGGALAGRAYKKGFIPMLVGGAAGSFAMVNLTKPKMPAPGTVRLRFDGGPTSSSSSGLSSGTGALIVFGLIGAAVLYGDKALKKLGG